MSAAVYNEPYRFPAGILALLVHGAFFALLYFGFSWQTLPPVTMSAELWQSLPEVAAAQPVKPKVVEEVKPVQPEEVVKPDIVLPDKKKNEIKPVPPTPDKKKTEAKPAAQKPRVSSADQQAAREQAEQAAATGRVVDEFTGKIQGKIRRNVVMPPNVPVDARAEFSVTLLPGGTVLSARLTRSSGNAAYDNAVERAILKSQPLPLPPDVQLFNRFRELKLVFKPTE
jgi:colicin import membrane protein